MFKSLKQLIAQEGELDRLNRQFANQFYIVDNPYFGDCLVKVIAVIETPFVNDEHPYRAYVESVAEETRPFVSFTDYLAILPE